jgi:hypothetical protein
MNSLVADLFGGLGGTGRLSLTLAIGNTPFYLLLMLLDLVLELKVICATNPGLQIGYQVGGLLTDFCSSVMFFHSSPMILEHAGRDASKCVRTKFKLTWILLTEHGSSVVVVKHVCGQGTLGSVLLALLFILLTLLFFLGCLLAGDRCGLFLLAFCRAGFVYSENIRGFAGEASTLGCLLRLVGYLRSLSSKRSASSLKNLLARMAASLSYGWNE